MAITLIRYKMMEKKQIQLGFIKAHQSYASEALAQQKMVYQLMKMWPNTLSVSSVERILEIGCGSGFLTRELAAAFSPKQAIINDLSPNWEEHVREFFTSERWTFQAADAEEQSWEGKFHLIASSACIQWFADPAAFLVRMFEQLHPSGVLLISSFGSDNLKEIRALTGEGLFYPDIDSLLEPFKEASVLESRTSDPIQLHFQSPLDVLQHLKRTGVNRSHAQFWTPRRLRDFSEGYAQFQRADGTYPLTYDPIYFCIQKSK